MKFGLHFANRTFPDPAPAQRVARAAEAAGFESLITVEHVVREVEACRPRGARRVLVSSAAFLPDPEARLAAFGDRVIRRVGA